VAYAFFHATHIGKFANKRPYNATYMEKEAEIPYYYGHGNVLDVNWSTRIFTNTVFTS